MNRSGPWDASASGPPVASGQVPYYNPVQFQQDHSTGSAVAPLNAVGDAGHGAVSADYPYGWDNNWYNWPHGQGYNSAGYDSDYYVQQQQSAEFAPSLTEGGVICAYQDDLVYDPNWSIDQPYPMQYTETGEYSYDPTVVGVYNNLATGRVDSSNVNTSQGAMQLYASHTLEDSSGMSPFFHPGNEVNSGGLPPPQVAPPNKVMEGVQQFSGEQLPAVNSFSNISHQPSPFDELGDMKSPRASLPEQPSLPTSHSRQSSAGGGVQFLIGGSSSVSESQSRTDSPHAPGMEAACSGTERKQDEVENRTVVTEHLIVSQPHFTDAGSHKNLTGRIDDSPVQALLPQGTMTGTPASGHHRKPAAGSNIPLQHPHMQSDFAAAVSSDSDATRTLSYSANSEFVHPEVNVSEPECSFAQQPLHPVNDSEVLENAEDGVELHADMYAGLLVSHSDSLFTPVGKAVAVSAAVSPGQQSTGSRSAAVPHMQTGSVCSAAGSDGGMLDMHEIELDAMVDSGSPQDVVRNVAAGSSVESVGECGAGSGTLKQNVHDVSSRNLVHHHAKAHREATMSPATTLWENPEPTGIRLLPAPTVLTEYRSTADRLLTHELLQNTDAGPSKSGASGVVYEPSLDVHSAMHSADDQRVPQTPHTSSTLSQTSSINYSVPSQVASEFSSHTLGHQPMIQPATTGPDMSGTVQNEPVDSFSGELARSNISSVNTSNNVLAKPSHVAVLQTSGKPTVENVTTVPAGSVVAGRDVIPGPQSAELRPSACSEVDHSRGMVAFQAPHAVEQNVKSADKNSQGTAHIMQSKSVNVHEGAGPFGEKVESSGVAASSQRPSNQQKAHHEYDDSVHVVKSEQQQLPSSVPGVPEERYRTPRYRAEVDRPLSRQDDVDHVNRRPLSRQDDDRAYNRPHSRQDYDDRGYDRPRSKQEYDMSRYRQMSEDPYGRPRSRQGYEDQYYYRPRSRQGYDDQRGAGRSYVYPEDGRQQRPAYESRHDRPSSRQSYHEPVDRPRSQQEYDYRSRSQQEYEDWSARSRRDHEADSIRYRDNYYGNADSYNRQGSRQELLDERDPHQAYRRPDESFNRSRYNAPEEGYDRMSRNSQQDDPRYRASQGYREEGYRRPRSRGGEMCFLLRGYHTAVFISARISSRNVDNCPRHS